jgi:hypothetical protein
MAALNRPSACDGANRKEEVKSQLAKAGAQILKRPNVGDREVLAIEGIKQPLAAADDRVF